MNAFDATKATIDVSNSWPFASSMRMCDTNDALNTLPRWFGSNVWKTEGAFRDASKRHDGEMLPPAAILDVQLDSDSWSSSHERMRRSARRASRPAFSRLETRPPTRREPSEVDLIRRASSESRVRPLRVEPGDVVVELAAERGPRQRNDR